MKVCNFCGKSLKEVKYMIDAEGGDICDECVLTCMKVLIDMQKDCKEINFKNKEK